MPSASSSRDDRSRGSHRLARLAEPVARRRLRARAHAGAAAGARRSRSTRSRPSTSSARTGSRRRRERSRRCSSPRGSPSVRPSRRTSRSWSERITVDGEEADLEPALARVRSAAERLGATQFETITAAALAEFAAREVDAAVVEAGLGGRLDATNVLRSRVVLLTNVGPRAHGGARRDAGGDRREKLAVVQSRARSSCCPTRRSRPRRRARGASSAAPREAAEAFLGRPVDRRGPRSRCRGGSSSARGRGPRRRAQPRRSPLARRPRCEPGRYVDRRIRAAGQGCRRDAAAASRLGDTLVATESTNARALPADDLAARAERLFAARRGGRATRAAAVARAHELGERVLVTGSLYLLADLGRARDRSLGVSSAGTGSCRSSSASSCSRSSWGRVCGWVYRRQTAGLTMRLFLAAQSPTTTNDSLFGGVNDFFDSDTWLVIRNLAIFFVVVFWLATVYWVYKDARRRIAGPVAGGDGDDPRAASRRSSGRSSTSSCGRPSTSRTCASASSRSARWRSAWRRATRLPGVPRRGRARRISSARSARRA